MDVSAIGIDLGNNSCGIAGADAGGAVVFRRRASRAGVIEIVRRYPGCVVAMGARCGTHRFGRLFAEEGHEVRLMSPEYVRPNVKARKNDDRDAEAIAEAATRPRNPSRLSPSWQGASAEDGYVDADWKAECLGLLQTGRAIR